MATDVERLVVRLEATQRTFEKQLAAANQSANRRARQIETRFERMNRTVSHSAMMAARSLATAFAGGLFAGGAAGMARGVRSVVSEMSEMAKVIERVGLSARTFQELQFGFELAGVARDEFSKGMEQFTRRIGEASMGTGRLREILDANGVALRDQHGRMRSNEALLRDYASLVKNAGSEQERMTLATEAFGRGGVAFVNALKNGATGFDDMADAAAAAGGTIDEKLLKKAEEFDDRWAASWRNFEINGKSAILTVLSVMDDLGPKTDDIGDAIGNAGIFLEAALNGYTGSNAVANAFAGQLVLIEANEDSITILATDVSEVEAALNGYNGANAVANAFAAQTALIEANEDDITILASDVSAVEAALTGYLGSNAVASAFSQHLALIEANEDDITATAALVAGVESQVDNFYASGRFRVETVATQSGATATVGISAAASDGSPTQPAALLLSSTAGGINRVTVLADQFVVWNGVDTATPFIFQDSIAYMEGARIGTVIFNQLSSANGKLVLKGAGTNASLEIFS
ncbi:MAG: hypothetical protein K5872_08845 [Rhizobiaceae bacterium]|nr:hypothetical protein [Rhizobiaceae bacterium]MCV0406322.1 hypothetical protein [Rhizobiaceae bacterium]